MNRQAGISEDQAVRLEEASAWHIQLCEDGQPSAALTKWLADPRNRAAFDAVAYGWNAFSDQDLSSELIRLRQAALFRAGRHNANRWRWALMPRYRMWQGAAAVLIGILLLLFHNTLNQERQTYVTASGEQRVLTLVDGSRLSLDSASRVIVDYTQQARTFRLEYGQARFDVAHDSRRPFAVSAGNQTVVAVGTSFNVEQLSKKVFVTIIEGRVVVRDDDMANKNSGSQSPSSLMLSEGQMLIAERGRKPLIVSATVANATAWQNGMLIFDNDTLADAVARVNRYTDRPISVDQRVGEIRVSGAFKAGDANSFVEAATIYFPIDASIGQDGGLTLTARAR